MIILCSIVQTCLTLLLQLHQFYLKDKCGATWNAWLREPAIPHFGRDIDFPFVAYTHLLHGYNPSFDKVAETNCQGSTATAAVKLLAVDCTTCIMCRDYTTDCRMLPSALPSANTL